MSLEWLILLVFFATCQCFEPVVKTALGEVQGLIQNSYNGRPFSVFEGIPYAKSPIGKRRFQEPEPIEPWHGVWQAVFPTICAQMNMTQYGRITGTEDCLHLNIYVPRKEPNSTTSLDVIVHIHGGAFIVGFGHDYCQPTFVMDHDVILVTFNYRLGVFGFLSTQDDVVPGNNGLKDQVLALEWIQNHIKSFGGNPNSITLNGFSAGSASVHLHYFSDMSKGLFHRGFGQSGTALDFWVTKKNPVENAKRLADLLGCPTFSSLVMVECLKQRPYQQLLKKNLLFYKYSILPFLTFGPVAEHGKKPFLKDLPYNLLKRREILDVPLIFSHSVFEGTFPAFVFTSDLKTINEKWLELAPYLLGFNDTLPVSKWESTSQKIKNYYIGQEPDINEKSYLKLLQMFGDRYFYVDAEDAIGLQASINKSPVYYYRFGYPTVLDPNKVVGHSRDIKYFFGKNIFSPKDLTADELKMKDVMVNMLVSYAKTGVPMLKDMNLPATKGNILTYVNITGYKKEDIQIVKTGRLTPREFWKSLGFMENENLGLVKDEL